ncbi:MAG: tyrosine-type recombinase/integrase [Verrucomicrobiae bacterium]|nr:tyrosine-type recombinase/integrase [Verrucomicrobiae bacterium]
MNELRFTLRRITQALGGANYWRLNGEILRSRPGLLHQDLEAAGIPFLDEHGHRFDFHSFRHSFATRLAARASGAPLSSTMQAMRHSDPSLTAKNYFDANAMPLAPMIHSLPGIGEG